MSPDNALHSDGPRGARPAGGRGRLGALKTVIFAFAAAALAMPACAQEAIPPREGLERSAPPAVTLEAKPQTHEDVPLIVCPKPQVDEQGNLKPTLEGCRREPPKKERHPDYGKGKLYSLTPV